MKVHAAVLVSGLVAGGAGADTVQNRVAIQSLPWANGASFSPLPVGFHDGNFDPWHGGTAPGPGVQRIAELVGDEWMAEFAAARAIAVSGGVVASLGSGPGIFLPGGLPGGSGSAVFTPDTALDRFVSCGPMVVPSNDCFIASDSSSRHALFDAGGVFTPTTATPPIFSITSAAVPNSGSLVLLGTGLLMALRWRRAV